MQHRLTIGRYYECLENVGNRDAKKFIAFHLYFLSLSILYLFCLRILLAFIKIFYSKIVFTCNT